MTIYKINKQTVNHKRYTISNRNTRRTSSGIKLSLKGLMVMVSAVFLVLFVQGTLTSVPLLGQEDNTSPNLIIDFEHTQKDSESSLIPIEFHAEEELDPEVGGSE